MSGTLIASAGNYRVYSSFGTRAIEGSLAGQEQGPGTTISFRIEQTTPLYSFFYWEIFGSSPSDFWNMLSNRIGGAVATSNPYGFTSPSGETASITFNADRLPEPTEGFTIAFMTSVVNGARVAEANFYIVDDDGPRVASGGNGPDRMTGTEANDSLDGMAGDDILLGFGGFDELRGGLGNDVIRGDSSVDTAIFAFSSSQATIRFNAGASFYTITSPEGTDTLYSVEKLRFTDGDRWIEDAAGLTGVVHRFYNSQTGMHFVTAANAEANWIRTTLHQFEHEGLAFRTAPVGAAGATEVYRFFNTITQAHFYTTSSAERDSIYQNLQQFSYEGAAYLAYASDRGPQEELYRFYNVETRAHFFTTAEAERDWIIASLPQFRYEGIAFFVDVV